MSEIKCISPLLDGFSMGNPMSEHHGVRCCPAIKENSDKKYIVKIVSVPASQVQLDALLLAGAYKDPADAMEYFRQLGQQVMQEAELLRTLSKLDGFLSYEGWQMEPITRRRLGYQIYLVGSYKRSLEKFLKKHPVTHLEAMNLGLDLCAALAMCRSAGAMYVALKPANIFVSEKKDYRIGDLGFLQLNTLSYAALPEKYLSPYSPAELFDPMAPMNLTVDTYAVGMILYQLYNDGQLPFKGRIPPLGEVFPAPAHADYELAEIILKAIHPDPAQRWDDPKELGKALAAYMQRNTVNDIPITPHVPLDIKPEDMVVLAKKKPAPTPEVPDTAPSDAAPMPDESDALPGESATDAPAEEAGLIADDAADAIPAEAEETELLSEEAMEEPIPEDAVEEPIIEEPVSAEPPCEPVPQEPEAEIIPEEPEAEAIPVEPEVLPETETPDPEPAGMPAAEESVEPASEVSYAEPEEAFVPAENVTADDAEEPVCEAPSENIEAAQAPAEDEFSRMIAKADDLIAHEMPDGMTVEEEDPFDFLEKDPEDVDDSDIPQDPLMDGNAEESTQEPQPKKKKKEKSFADPKYRRRKRRFLSGLVVLGILGALAAGGFWYYQNQYLQTIDAITIDGGQDTITVCVDSQLADSMLVVRCADPYGTTSTKILTDGKVTFTNLTPNTMYTIRLEVDGFHKLVGKTSDVFTTDATTVITDFTCVTGVEDGSVQLNFTVEGDEPKDWIVFYSTEGQEEKRTTFTGHSVTISELSVGKRYTFRLESSDNAALGGTTTLEAMASRLILAENLAVSSENGTDILVTWNAPGDTVVDSWNVRCYSSSGYEQLVTVTDTAVSFAGIDPNATYTVEVTAAGMTKFSRTSITAHPLNVTGLQVDDSAHDKLSVSWEYTGNTPEGGWLLIYEMATGEKNVVKCEEPQAQITPKVPGATYKLTLQAANGTTVFNSVYTHSVEESGTFENHGLTADMLTIDLVVTPETPNWRCESLSSEDYTTTFSLGDSISLAMRSSGSFYLPGSQVNVLYVIRDTYGNTLPGLTAQEQFYWKNIWNGGSTLNGELTLPVVPNVPGSYVLDLYFDGMQVTSLPFTVN